MLAALVAGLAGGALYIVCLLCCRGLAKWKEEHDGMDGIIYLTYSYHNIRTITILVGC